MRAFPHRQWAQYAGRVARCESGGLLEMPDVFGDMVLRRAIAGHLCDWRGVDVSPEQVVITAGAGDAMELVLQTVAPDGGPVALENPGYPLLAQACRMLGNPLHWLAVDDAGACLPDTPVALSVITPSCQFPLGMTMPIARRQAHLAGRGWIVEDDFDSEFRYSGTPVPALMALDQAQKVIYLGSFSKVFSSGLRLGYLVFPDRLLDQVRRVQKARGNRASVMPQRVLGRFMEDGAFHRHVRKMRRLYRGRRGAFLDGLAARFGGGLRYRDYGAGMSVALEFAAPVDETGLRAALRGADLECPMLSDYFFDGPALQGMLCGFCAFDEAEIARGLVRLETVLMPFLDQTNDFT
jgi:GntR family transcriptional regulator/MocR family aminotransferase